MEIRPFKFKLRRISMQGEVTETDYHDFREAMLWFQKGTDKETLSLDLFAVIHDDDNCDLDILIMDWNP